MNLILILTLVFLLIFVIIFLIILLLVRPTISSSSDKGSTSYLEEEILRRTGMSNPLVQKSCQLYSTLSLETEIVDSLQGIPITDPSILCDDGLTMTLEKVESTCLVDECRAPTGDLLRNGQRIVYYRQCGEQLATCVTGRSFLEVPAIGQIRCLTITSEGRVEGLPCSSSNLNSTLVLEKEPRSTKFRIRKPQTNLCLNSRQPLSTSQCSQLRNKGYNWLLIGNQIAYVSEELTSESGSGSEEKNPPIWLSRNEDGYFLAQEGLPVKIIDLIER